MFKRIMVPVDFSEKNRAALRVVGELAAHHRAEVTLLHVIEEIGHLSPEEFKDFYPKLEKDAKQKMRVRAKTLIQKGIVVQQKIVCGRRAREIVRCAVGDRIDLLVLSSHPIDPREPAESWSTISYQVAIIAPCPVLLVK